MTESRSLLYSTLLLSFGLFSFTGCENKTVQETVVPVENTTEIFTDSFTLKDTKQHTRTMHIVNQKMTLQNMDRPIVILNFFSTSSAPSCGEIPYLSDLQKKYKKDLFITGILVNDVLNDEMLKEFINRYHINYFISNAKKNNSFFSQIKKNLHLSETTPTPLTVIYKDGDYYTHYEGAVPIEMIDHNIQQIIKK